MVEQGYNYEDGFIQNMAKFLKTKIEKLERFDYKKGSTKGQKITSIKKRKNTNQNVSEDKSAKKQKAVKILSIPW